jgi:DNA-binding GntR family transcriptional regulator
MASLNRLRLIDDLCQLLETAILSGKMRPGERLLVTQLATEHEVSQSTIREALLMLESRGLVVSKPRHGTFVTRLSDAEAIELCQARALLETFAVTQGHLRIDDTLLQRLRTAVAAMGQCALPQDLPQLIQLDLTFHRAIIDLSGSTKLIDLWAGLNGQIGALMLRGMEQQALDISDVVRLHTLVIDALTAGTPAQAQQAIVDHYIRDEAENIHYFLEIPQTVDLVTAKIG